MTSLNDPVNDGGQKVGYMGGARFVSKAVNFNAGTTDTLLPITMPASSTQYLITDCIITNASHTLATATVSLCGAAAGAAPVFAADQAITVTSGTANTLHNTQSLTLVAGLTPLTAVNYSNLYIYVGTAEGAAATADVTDFVKFLP